MPSSARFSRAISHWRIAAVLVAFSHAALSDADWASAGAHGGEHSHATSAQRSSERRTRSMPSLLGLVGADRRVVLVDALLALGDGRDEVLVVLRALLQGQPVATRYVDHLAERDAVLDRCGLAAGLQELGAHVAGERFRH